MRFQTATGIIDRVRLWSLNPLTMDRMDMVNATVAFELALRGEPYVQLYWRLGEDTNLKSDRRWVGLIGTLIWFNRKDKNWTDKLQEI